MTDQPLRCCGDFQNGLTMRFCLFGKLSAHMTPLQRVGGSMLPSLALHAMVLPIFVVSLPLLLVSGQPMIAYQTPAQLRCLLRMACLMVISDWNHDLLYSSYIGYRTYLRWLEAPTWMSPCVYLLPLFRIPAIESSMATRSSSQSGSRPFRDPFS